MKKVLVFFFILLVGLGIYGWGLYNQFVTANETVKNQWAQVETQYQRRYDLIPNLVESVKGIMTQEQKVFGEIAEARTRYGQARTSGEKVVAVNELETALSRLLVIVENYPELKSAESVQALMIQLEGTENRISVERKRYNEAVRSFNLMVKKVPGRWVAGFFGFEELPYFEAVPGSQQPPPVRL